MTHPEFRRLVIDAPPAAAPEVGTWLWALADAHRMLFNAVRGASPEVLDFAPPRKTNTIGTLLYHIAATDAAWLYEDILREDFPPEVEALFPFDYRNEKGDLWPLSDVPLEAHLSRLMRIREILVGHVKDMGIETFRAVSKLEKYEVSPEWILYHLAEHENYHRGQVVEIRKEAEGSRATG